MEPEHLRHIHDAVDRLEKGLVALRDDVGKVRTENAVLDTKVIELARAMDEMARAMAESRVRVLPLAGLLLTLVVSVSTAGWFVLDRTTLTPLSEQVSRLDATIHSPTFRTPGADALFQAVQRQLFEVDGAQSKLRERVAVLEDRLDRP